jgi:phage tail-like protein
VTAPKTDQQDQEARPFNAFRFALEVKVENVSSKVCAGSFSEIDGLEMTIEPKTIREGGRNNGPVQLSGAITYGQVTLKRGMTENFDLWKWFERVTTDGSRGLRADAEIVVFAPDGSTEQARFILTRAMPVKLKAPSLNAREGTIAIEEMQLVYETLALRNASGAAASRGGS